MKISRFTDSQIMAILKQNEAGASVPDLCREHGISSASVYTWRAKFGGMDASLMKRMKELEDENRRLKKMYAEERLKAEIAKGIIAKKWWSQLGDENWLAGPKWNMTLAFELLVMYFRLVPPVIFINQRW